jgi:DNA-binding XRE family transcriptional regulator
LRECFDLAIVTVTDATVSLCTVDDTYVPWSRQGPSLETPLTPEEQFKKAFGTRLAKARAVVGADAEPRRRVSQRELGDVVGLSDVAVGAWEDGRNEPSLFHVAKMAEHMGVRPAWLAFGDGEMRDAGATLKPPPPKAPELPKETLSLDKHMAGQFRGPVSPPASAKAPQRKRRGGSA